MKSKTTLLPEFVVSVPSPLEQGVLYVSMEFATVIHLCPCGCGNKVVTPLKRAGWELRFTEEGVSLYPSVGCWSFPCRSHYWVNKNEVIWSNGWSDKEIQAGREETEKLHRRYEKKKEDKPEESASSSASHVSTPKAHEPTKNRVRRLLEKFTIWK